MEPPCTVDNDQAIRSPIRVELLVNGGSWSDDVKWDYFIEQVVAVTCRSIGFSPPVGLVELSVVLTSDDAIRKLNLEFRGKDQATDVLSFLGDGAELCEQRQREYRPLLLGDIVVAYETVIRDSAALRKSVCDHLSRLIIHGLLHLLGYDHEEEALADQMEDTEKFVLTKLGIDANVY